MNIKERIKTIIEDYSFIVKDDNHNVRNNIKRTYKSSCTTEKPSKHM